MGPDALGVVNELDIPLRRELRASQGQIQRLTPTVEALYVPNIDDALDEESAKREFWSSFRVLGTWWADLPPYCSPRPRYKLGHHGPRREEPRPGRRSLRGVRSEADHGRAADRARIGRPGALLD